jgi:arginyl-tRNA synthetase
MWSEARDVIAKLVHTALERAVADGALSLDEIPEIPVDSPKEGSHGDLACPVALGLARAARMAPRAIAEAIVERIEIGGDIEKVEIAGPGFINFFLSDGWVRKALRSVLDSGDAFGTSDIHAGKTALVEFVSANPTGPLTLGHGRQGVIGDTVSRMLEAVGYTVTREYYFNNAGRQMVMLGESVRARYLEELDLPAEFPEDGYQGEYIRDIARDMVAEHGRALVDLEDVTPFKDKAVEVIFGFIQRTLERIDIRFDEYYNEHTLYERGLIDDVVQVLRDGGYAYDKDGAVWFKSTAFGLPQDRPIIRSTAGREPTYRLPDMAYHREKLRRGFDRIIDIFGADHVDEYPDVLAGVRALGYDTDSVSVLIHQFVTLEQDGETVKMSTRRANYITVDELVDEVGEDAVRFFFIMRNMNTHLKFDVDLAKTASSENPVFYLQYAHARICSIFRQAEERGIPMPSVADVDLALLGEPEEAALIKKCAELPRVVEEATEAFEPHAIPHYLTGVATAFHQFYDRCRVLDADNLPRTSARMLLAKATQTVLANGLGLLGVRAPESM